MAGAAGTLPSQLGAVPGHKMSNVVAPSPPPRGFMPVTGSGVVQGPNLGSIQPPSPTQSTPVQTSVTPAAPPPTIQTVDTSNVPGNWIYYISRLKI